MNRKTFTFLPDETVAERKEKIMDELQPLMPLNIIEATLSKTGYPDIEYGYGDDDLKFADSITFTYEQRITPKCKKCGCYDTMACIHADLGPCWWVKGQENLCSHCQLEAQGKITDVLRPWLTSTSHLNKPETWKS